MYIQYIMRINHLCIIEGLQLFLKPCYGIRAPLGFSFTRFLYHGCVVLITFFSAEHDGAYVYHQTDLLKLFVMEKSIYTIVNKP